MKRSVKYLFLILIVFASSGELFAQVSLRMKRPPINQLKAADLWSATITNNGEAFTAYLYGSMTNSENSELIATGQTMTFEIKKGTTNFKVSDLARVPDISYLSKDPKYKKSFINTGGAPSGDYKICIELRRASNEIAGEDCINQKISGGDAPQLISPRDGEELKIENPVFTWMHMKSSDSDQTYTLIIVEISRDESPENAMLKNKAFFEKEGITQQLFQYPLSASRYDKGKKYAWQVVIGNLKSPVYTFSTASGSDAKVCFYLGSGYECIRSGCCHNSMKAYKDGDYLSDREVVMKFSFFGDQLKGDFVTQPSDMDEIFKVEEDIMIDKAVSKMLNMESMTIIKDEYKIDHSKNKYGSVLFNLREKESNSSEKKLKIELIQSNKTILETITDSQGNFLLKNIPEGQYGVKISNLNGPGSDRYLLTYAGMGLIICCCPGPPCENPIAIFIGSISASKSNTVFFKGNEIKANLCPCKDCCPPPSK